MKLVLHALCVALPHTHMGAVRISFPESLFKPKTDATNTSTPSLLYPCRNFDVVTHKNSLNYDSIFPQCIKWRLSTYSFLGQTHKNIGSLTH